MDSLLEQVNSLIKMKVGEPYRLEHIKSRLEENKVLTLSDKTYLNDLLERYIRNVGSVEPQASKIEPSVPSSINSDFKNCWKCGTENPNIAKFCHGCGSLIEKLPDKPKLTSKKPKQDSQSWIQTRSTTMPKRMGKGKKILIGIGIIAAIIIIIWLIEGDKFLETIENLINGLQQQLGSLLGGLSVELKINNFHVENNAFY